MSKENLKLQLDRPLAIFDIESTGVSPRADRIIELAIIRVEPGGGETEGYWLLNPTIPIPVETTAVHGITNEVVKDCPTFADVAKDVLDFIKGCDLGGYNVIRFDIPMLQEELGRVKLDLDLDNRRVLDAQRIYHQKEPRDLTAALRFFCGVEHTDAHGAQSDTRATLDVIKGQFLKYDDLPLTMEELDRQFNASDPFNVDRSGRLRWVNNEITINFGQRKGEILRKMVNNKKDASYLKWILRSDFPADTRKIVSDALEGRYPDPPTPVSQR